MEAPENAYRKRITACPLYSQTNTSAVDRQASQRRNGSEQPGLCAV